MDKGIFTVELKIHDSLPKSLIVKDDGTIIFIEGEKTDQVEGASREVELLREYILNSDFFQLGKRYTEPGACDFVAHTLTITIGNKTHAVYCSDNCPKIFNNLVEKIKSLWPYKIEYQGFA